MQSVTFITGNQKKADYLARYLDHPITHQKVELDEMQSLDLHTVVEHKVKQAYAAIQKPVLVEDVSLEFCALGRLPGTFIRFFMDEMPAARICQLLDNLDRQAIARCMFGYYDGNELRFFEGRLDGTIAIEPAGQNGFGWDTIFIPEGYTVTRACLSEEDDQKTYVTLKPFAQVKAFLTQIEA